MDYFTFEEYRASIAKLPVSRLRGELAQFRANKITGTMGPNFERALLEAAQLRADELHAHDLERALGPKRAWALNAQLRRAEEEERANSVVVRQNMGKGGFQTFLVPLKKVEGAARRADDVSAPSA